MTKVELEYDLVRKLEDADTDAISNVHGFYGIQRVKIEPGLDKIHVAYDASRLSARDVEGALVRYGVPIRRA